LNGGDNVKVGIVTIYDNKNLGNRLQNYALQTILRGYACSVVTIKNKPFSNSLFQRIKVRINIGDSIICNHFIKRYRKEKFLRFNKKYISMSKRCYYYNQEYNSKIEDCDFYCAGSDQVWNPQLVNTGKLHFLGFSPQNCNFSYAASFGTNAINDEYVDEVRCGLNNIKYISVREEEGREIVRKIIGRIDAETLIDPTLYLSHNEWNEISVKPSKMPVKPYIVLYFLGELNGRRRGKIINMALKKGLEIIDVLDKSSRYYNDIGPSEFLYLIKNASLVCTDSFHASVFSFIFEVPLAIFDREGQHSNMGGRLTNLAEKFGLQRCFAKNDTIPDDVWNADYSFGKEILKDERKKVDKFLNKVFYTNADSAKNGID